MAGIYIHVPFCKTRCVYCDFFTRTDQKLKNPYVRILWEEIKQRSSYLEGDTVDTIYLGGGTPSQLNYEDLKFILNCIRNEFVINQNAEITIEVNPDDLSEAYSSQLISLGFNRLSMGIQSFDDDLLLFLNRRHSASKAIDSVKIAQQAGFKNISIDLMYGLPNQDLGLWNKTLDTALNLDIEHISAYHLIYEEGTKLYRLRQKGKVSSVHEDLSLDMFSVMIDRLSQSDFIHYEISNFGKDGYLSRHNSSYWLGTKYLGLGPAAHSYNHKNRSWNVASIPQYIDGVRSRNPNIEIEELDEDSAYNDFVLTGMRTMWGVKAVDLESRFNINKLSYFEKNIQKHLKSGTVVFSEGIYKLTKQGIFISDSIMSDLMYID